MSVSSKDCESLSNGAMVHCDVAIIGGGIVGLATAMTLREAEPGLHVHVVEAERNISTHQSGNNSGVLHSGLYYKPGSWKAIACKRGKELMEGFCDDEGVAWDRCGKVVVATCESELQRLDMISERATANGVAHQRIHSDELRRLEPHASGIAALHVPAAGIVNYRRVCDAMRARIERRGGLVTTQFDVQAVRYEGSRVVLVSRQGPKLSCQRFINCGGLRSDRISRLAGVQSDTKIVPFRGEYYELIPGRESLCRNLIYPVPDPSFPFLGVHFTRMIDGGVECGPNAVLALSRAGYRWRDVNATDLLETLRFGGFRKLAMRHWRTGAGEVYRSIRKQAFVT
ncbi:MAG: L-2-hydroxyglutarate oxidase, partial [Planctomycetota bacterium]